MSTPKPNSDHELDLILAALRHAEPTLGMDQMQQRILNKLAAQPTPAPRRSFALGWRPAFAAAALTAVAVLATYSLHHTHRTPTLNASTQPADALTQPRPISEHQSPAQSQTSRLSILSKPSHAYTLHPSSQPVHPPTLTLASFPAPTLPLTPQEQLLVRLARRGEPQQFAALPADAHGPGNDFAGLDPRTAPPLPQSPPLRPRSHIPPDMNPEPAPEPASESVAQPIPEPAATEPAAVAPPEIPATSTPPPQPGDPTWQPVLK